MKNDEVKAEIEKAGKPKHEMSNRCFFVLATDAHRSAQMKTWRWGASLRARRRGEPESVRANRRRARSARPTLWSWPLRGGQN